MKIAIMMLVHKNQQQVQRLINHLSADFDIFVHIDKRVSLQINEAKNVFVYRKYKSYHGSFNQIMSTLYLLKKAFDKAYDRYILISGQDLPLKTNKDIKDFFTNNDNEYIDIAKIPRADGWPDMRRLTAYHINNNRHEIFLIRHFFKLIHSITKKIFRVFSKINPRKLEYNFYGGANWTNYSHKCVQKIFEYLEKDTNFIKRFRWTHCADEIFYQTIISQLQDIKVVSDSLRYVDWHSGPEFPKTLREEDYDKIISSGAIFARKFDENIDKKIIEMIYENLNIKPVL